MNFRIYVLWLCFFIIIAVVLTRMVYVQILRRDFFISQAQKQHNVSIVLPALRGIITDRHKHVLAHDIVSFSLYAQPKRMTFSEKQKVAKSLARVLGLDPNFLSDKLKTDKAFIWIKRKLPLDIKKKINRMKLKGLGWIEEYSRNYPDGSLASQLLGFVNTDRKGVSGIELMYDDFLRGEDGVMWLVRDGRRIAVPLNDDYLPPRNGLNLELTLDEVIQSIVEKALDWMCEKFHPKSAWAVVMDPFTGEILAMASRPTFDLNEYSSAPFEAMRNRVITDMFEPGSVFKIVTASAAIEEGIVDEETKIFCENGAYKIFSRVLHDHHPYGTLSFKEVIEKSSNIGTVKVAQKLGEKRLYDYIKKFGFGCKTGIDLPGEAPGLLRPIQQWSKVSISTIPIGQGIAATSIQLACAISVIANGGYWVEPYVCRKIVDSYGVAVRDFTTKKRKKYRVISMETANRIKEILKAVVEKGTGRRAKLPGFEVAGKTGTAQKPIPGGYSNIYFMSSFIGFVPADSPQVVIVVTADTKKPFHYGGVVAAPTFQRIAKQVLNYLGIAPSKTAVQAQTK